MSCSVENYSPGLTFGNGAGFGAPRATLLRRLAFSYRVYRTARLLSGLENQTLRDIGLARDDIQRAATAAVRRSRH